MQQVKTGIRGSSLFRIFDFYSIWPPMLCIALLQGLVSTPLFRVLDAPPTANPKSDRVRSIDGLRGYLSLAVVIYHAAILRLYLQRGTFQPNSWEPPSSRLFALLGPAAVSLFFMITGFLFWSRILKKRGRLNWTKFYIGRVFRIGPLYFLTIGLALFLDHCKAIHYAARMSGALVSPAKQAASLMLLGLSVYPDEHKFLFGVTWSIQYEWFFYLCLPFLALLYLFPRLQLASLALTLAACFSARMLNHTALPGSRTFPIMASLFLIGMICGDLMERDVNLSIPDWVKSMLCVGLLVTVFAFSDMYTPGPALLVGGIFYLICSGCTLFGLLTTRAALRLGDVSYSIYMLQGLAFALCLRPTSMRELFLRSPSYYWLLTLISLVVLLLFATLTYSVIEQRGIRMGRLFAVKVDKLLGLEPFASPRLPE